MGQNIQYIITDQKVEVPKEIVHFKERDCTVIPLDLCPPDNLTIAEAATNNGTLQGFLRTLENESVDWDNYKEANEITLQEVVDIIKKLSLTTFGMICFDDLDFYYIAILERKVIEIEVNENYYPRNFYLDPHELLGLSVNMKSIMNKSRYSSYQSAVYEYFRNPVQGNNFYL